MGTYPDAAVERAMKIQEVLLRAMSGQISWVQAAAIIGLSDRQMRRWRERLEAHGYDGLFDRRRQTPSPKRVPLATVEEVLRLYRTQYADCDAGRSHESLAEHHQVALSCNRVKKALQTAGLVPRVYVATSTRVAGATPAPVRPPILWNADAIGAAR